VERVDTSANSSLYAASFRWIMLGPWPADVSGVGRSALLGDTDGADGVTATLVLRAAGPTFMNSAGVVSRSIKKQSYIVTSVATPRQGRRPCWLTRRTAVALIALCADRPIRIIHHPTDRCAAIPASWQAGRLHVLQQGVGCVFLRHPVIRRMAAIPAAIMPVLSGQAGRHPIVWIGVLLLALGTDVAVGQARGPLLMGARHFFRAKWG